MKRGLGILLICILLVSPLILAEEQAQVYSGFDRFVDNIKLIFSSGDNKLMLILNVHEKEVNSAIVNTQNGDDDEAERNMERAVERLQYVQTKVSNETAGEVQMNVENTMNKIVKENLTEKFEIYMLEEEKTQLTVKLVVEFEGAEGQTLKREIVRDETTGKNTVKIVIEGEPGEGGLVVEGSNGTKAREIIGELGKVQNEIAEKVVKMDVAEQTQQMNQGENSEIKNEVKTHKKGDGTEENEVVETDDEVVEGGEDEDNEDSSKEDTIKNEVVEGDGGEGDYAEGTTAEGENNVDDGPCSEGASDCAD